MFKNNEEKRFCRTADELGAFIKKDNELMKIFNDFDMEPEEVLDLLRNYMGHYVTTDMEKLDILRDKLSDFLRKEFDFLISQNVCAEDQLRLLISRGDQGDRVLKISSSWNKWFASYQPVSEEYESHDFEETENVIMYVIEHLGLPPIQEQYAKYYIGLKGGRGVYFSKFEQDILKAVGENLVEQDERICKMFDELLLS